jgi:CHAT domain-containing protein
MIAVSSRRGASEMRTPIPAWLGVAFLASLIPILVAWSATIVWAGQPRQTTVATVIDLKEVGDEAPVGKNRSDEACRLLVAQPRRVRIGAGVSTLQRYSLLCEGWTQPSGEIRRFASGNDYPPERLVTDSAWQKEFSTWLYDCGKPEPTVLRDGSSATVRQCKHKDGGWPVIVAATTAGARSYTFEALPTNLSLLEFAYEVFEGKRKAEEVGGSTGELSAAIRRAEALVGATGKLIGVQDIGGLDTLTRLGNNQTWAGNFRDSEATFRRALEIQERVLGVGVPSSGKTLTNLALSVSSQDRIEEADHLFARAEPLVRKAFTGDYPHYLAFRGMHEERRANHQEAIRLGRAAAMINFQRYGKGNAVAQSLIPVAHALRALNRLDEAATTAQEALQNLEGYNLEHCTCSVDTFDWEERLVQRGWIHNLLGLIRLDQRRFPEARAELGEALKLFEPLFGETVRVAEALEILGQVDAAEGNTAQALETFRRAAAIRVADPVARDRARVGQVAPYLRTLTAAATPAQRDSLAAEAFAVAQIPRGGEAAKALNAMAARVASADPALRTLTRDFQDAQRQRERLHMTLGAETLKPAEERDAKREERLKQQVREAEERVAQLERRLQAEAPRYMRLTAARPVPVSDLAPLLRPTEALLLALPTPTATFILLVRDGRTYVHQATVGGGIIRDKVKALRATLDLSEGAPRAFDLAGAHALYQTLLAPLAPHLTGVTHLLVIPAGPLQSLPLGLLVTQPSAPGGEGDYRHVAWLSREVALSVLPSVTALVDLRAVATRAAAPQPFLGVGDPAFTGQRESTRALQDALNACRLDGGIDVELLRGLPRLRETAQELTQIAQALGAPPESSVILGTAATKSRVTSTDLSQYRVVAFATHGLLPGELRCQAEPALALTPPTTPSPTDNGLLDASDIAQFRLDADWVVLSACNTAGPDGALGGESLSGLARAFFYAGARTLLVSHWAVASRPTVALTTGLFAQLAQTPTLGRAVALQRSQLTLADTPATSHPVFWAPFVLVGDGG